MTTPRSPTTYAPSRWAPVHGLLRSIDDQIAEVYAARGMAEVRPRFAPAVLVLAAEESDDGAGWNIRSLAGRIGVTHSAMSQTLAAMRSAGLVESVRGVDGRTRLVRLTRRGEQVAPFVQAEWRATETALAELEREVPYPLTQVAEDIEGALRRLPFAVRLTGHLDDAPAGPSTTPT
jgi:DNA-binding MarR family transcriptional regulator